MKIPVAFECKFVDEILMPLASWVIIGMMIVALTALAAITVCGFLSIF